MMKAVGYRTPSEKAGPGSLSDIDLPEPQASGRDLLVEVRAVSVNPVDYKVRRSASAEDGGWKVLGWDAAGVVKAVGEGVTLFRPGDEVFYAGCISRPGTNAELHRVDERIVGAKPRSLDWGEAAALPLTTITAWEALFDRLDVRRAVPGATEAILIVGAAGGVGSIAIQLARQLTGLKVIATASRPETQAWARSLGAHEVIDHGQPLAPQLEAIGVPAPPFVFSTTHTEQHFPALAEVVAPQGRIVFIDEVEMMDVMALRRKSASLHHELMFTRCLFETADMEEQGRLLTTVAGLVDEGRIRTTLTERRGPINADNLIRAHQTLESAAAIGKIVLEGFHRA